MTETEIAPPAGELLPRRNALFAIAVGAALQVTILYVLAVQTRWGQRLDATALRGQRGLRRQGVHAAGRLLTTIDVASLALIGGAIVLVALIRLRPRLAVGAFVLIAGSILTTEVLKKVILPRPDLGVSDRIGDFATYPSGHTTVAMSLALGATIVSPIRWRTVIAVIGAAFACGIGAAVVATGAHRPSDPIGAAFVVTAWAAVVLGVLVGRDADDDRSRGSPGVTPWFAIAGVFLIVLAFVAAVATAVAIHRDRLDTIDLGGAYVGATCAIVGTIFVCIAVLLAMFRGVDLDA